MRYLFWPIVRFFCLLGWHVGYEYSDRNDIHGNTAFKSKKCWYCGKVKNEKYTIY